MTQANGIAVWAEGIKAELARRLPRQRKTQRDKLAVLVATMLRQGEASRFQHQNAARAGGIAIEQMLGENRTEGPAAQDYDIKRMRVGARQCFIKAVTDIPAKNISGKVGVLRRCTRCHDHRTCAGISRQTRPPCRCISVRAVYRSMVPAFCAAGA